MLYSVLRTIAKYLFKLIYRVEVIGKEKIDYSERLIFCGNHKSLMDPLIVATVVDASNVHWMAKKELFENSFYRFILPKLNAFPVDRQGNDIKALKHSIRVLKNNDYLGIFPEGTRVTQYDESNVKDGIISIAKNTDSTIIPMYIEGGYKLFSKIRVFIRDPIRLDKDKKYTSEEIHEEAVKLLKRIYGKE